MLSEDALDTLAAIYTLVEATGGFPHQVQELMVMLYRRAHPRMAPSAATQRPACTLSLRLEELVSY